MGECKKCGKSIEDKYTYCLGCMDKYRNSNGSQTQSKAQNKEEINLDMIKLLEAISEHLKHINWNLGLISQTMVNKPKVVKQIQDEIAKDLNKTKPL